MELDTVVYSIFDGNGGTDTSSYEVTISPANDAPRPLNDASSVNEDGSVSINVLVNDSDIDGTIDPTTVQIGGTATAGDPLAVAGEGVWTVNATTGWITFTPEPDYDGLVSDISYTVRDDLGATSDPATISVTITPVNDAPIANADTQTVLEDGTAIISVLANDVDIDGTPDPATVQIGGTASAGDPLVVAGEGTWSVNATTGEITFTPEPDYTGPVTDISYTVADVGGLVSNAATVSVSITPVNDAPVSASDSDVVFEDASVVIDVLANDNDIDGTLDPATVQITGTAVAGDTLVVAGEGTWTVNNTTGEITFTPEPDYTGPVSNITYTVDDDGGLTGNPTTISVSITPVNDAPIATADSDVVSEDSSVVINVLSNDSDIDGTLDPATVQIAGTASAGDPLVVAGEGTWSVNLSTGAITFTPESDYDGAVTDITYTVRDDGGLTSNPATVSVSISGTNDNPVGGTVPDAGTNEDAPANNIDVLSYASDVDGDSVSVTGASATNGTATVNPDGTLNYTPNADYNGTDTITYDLSDGVGGTAVGSVDIVVAPVNDDPDAGSPPLGNTNEDTALASIDVLSHASDIDGDSLTVTGPTADNGTVFVNPDGTLNYTPNLDFNGLDTIAYTVDDGNGGTDSGIKLVFVNAINDAPDANDDVDSVVEDGSVSINVLGNDSDVDDAMDPTTVQIGGTASAGDPLVVPGEGAWTVNPVTGEITFTPVPNYTGAVSDITYTVDDNSGATSNSATVSVTIVPVNDAPVTVADSDIVLEDGSVVIDVLANDSDIDGTLDPATVQITGTSFAGDPLAVAGEGTWSINTTTGEITFTPEADYDGSVTDITYTVNDNVGATSNPATVSVSITPVNDAPILDLSNTQDVITNGTFNDGNKGDWTFWTESGGFDDGGVGANAPAVTERTDGVVATLMQTGLSGLSDGPGSNGTALVKFDFGWSDHNLDHGSESKQLTLNIGGVDYAQVTTPNGAGTFATVVYLNGASGPATPIPDSDQKDWAHYEVEVNLPASLADSGDLLFTWENLNGTGGHPDEISIDNVQVIVNDANLADTDNLVHYVARDPAVSLLDTSSSITDIDSANIQSSRIVLTNKENNDQLLVDGNVAGNGSSGTVNGLTWTSVVTGSTIEVDITGAGTHADYITALSLIAFENTNKKLDETTRVIDITVNDGTDDSAIAQARVAIGVDQQAPDPVDDNNSGFEDTPLVINVLANDLPGDAPIDPTTVQLEGTANPGHPLVVVGEGTWTVNTTTGDITFTGEPEYSGTPTPIHYSVSDTSGYGSVLAQVDVTIAAVNDAPTTVADSESVVEDGSVIIDVLANDTDIDGILDPATVQITGTASAGDPLAVAGEGTWSVNITTGEITFTPEADYDGTVTDITYTVRDDTGAISNPASLSVVITPGNDAPVTSDDTDTALEDGSVVIDILANDSDLDGTLDPTTVQITGTALAGDPLVVSGEGTWSVNTTTGEITFAPEPDYIGSVTDITYTVRDNSGSVSNPSNVSVSIIDTNDAASLDLDSGAVGIGSTGTFVEDAGPVAITSANVLALDPEDSLARVTVTLDALPDGSREMLSVGGPAFALDADSSGSSTLGSGLQVAYTYTALTRELIVTHIGGAGTPLSNANVEELVESLTYENTSDSPTSSDRTFTVVVEDSGGLTSPPADAVVTVQPANDAPTDMTFAAGGIDENASPSSVATTISTVDPDVGDSFTYALTSDLSGVFEISGNQIVVKAGANIDFETTTSHDVTVEVTDSGGLTYSESFTIVVNDVNETPTDIHGAGNQGTAINTDGGNAAYYQVTDGSALIGGLGAFTFETQFAIDDLTGLTNIELFSYHTGGSSDDIQLAIKNAHSSSPKITFEINEEHFFSSWDASELLDGA